MPNNCLYVGLIQLILPNARIIDARRHPLGCWFSCFKQHFARGQNFTYDLDDLGRYYRDYVELMAPLSTRSCPAECIGSSTSAWSRTPKLRFAPLLELLRAAVRGRLPRFYENERAVRTASSEQVRQPIFREGLDHWRHYEPWLGPLKGALGPVLAGYPDVPGTLIL